MAIVAIVALFFFGGSASSSGTLRYAIVFDAGSTGSRIHVFKFTVHGGQLDLESDTFEQLKPGLSSYADNPPAASASLEPLMKVALQTVPQKLQVVVGGRVVRKHVQRCSYRGGCCILFGRCTCDGICISIHITTLDTPNPQASTPVMLGATAGLRLLPEGKADIILQDVRQYLESSPFKLVADGVRVIDGRSCSAWG